MNAGKTRIYELSKELNRDNKDILEICERLNIAVKSHSSTIDDAQVERIRAEAKRYPHKAPSGVGSSDSVGNRPAARGNERNPEPARELRKPQIREILKSTTPPSSQASAPTPPKSMVQAARPRSPLEPSKSVEEALEPLETPNREDKPWEGETDSDFAASPEPEASSPQLLSPPPRGAKSPDFTKVSAIEKPILSKPKKKVKPGEARSSSPAPRPSAGTEGKTPVKPAAPVKGSGKGPALGARPKPPNAPKLDATLAPPPERTVPTPDDELEEETLLLDPPTEKPKLKRPTPPRAFKRDAEWEDEEEEGADGKGKVGKAGKLAGKGKRRSTMLEDEEEDLEELQTQLQSQSSVSISIARPPKPAAMQAAEQATVAAKKARKATPKTGDSSSSRNKTRERQTAKVAPTTPDRIVLPESLTVRELAERLYISENDVITKLFMQGIGVKITQTIDLATAKLVTDELGVTVEAQQAEKSAAAKTEMIEERDLESLQRRPPVVTIMGHVDHGKTTLLDSIRKTKVAQGEAGGITQHIGAYHVDVEHNGQTEQVVFLDTPGHEAFTAMRARGARITDIAILVVAADDGVQPQTREAISHAKAAGVPIIVAINKIDKPDSNPDRVMQELTELQLVPEEWGGETIMVPVSAMTGENLDTLLEMILLVAEVEQLEANPDRNGKGTVIEAHLDKAKGPVATLLIQNGSLRVGDIVVAGSTFGKIRAAIDDRGNRVEDATPSFAVEILGLNDVPLAGDEFEAFDNEKQARELAESRAMAIRETRLTSAPGRVSLSSLSAQAQEGTLKELNLIVKADVQGSVEALLGALKQLPQGEVQVSVLFAAPGEITETDVDFAAASSAVIVGFNTALGSGARQAADRAGVDIREYNIIYNLLDDVQAAMEGLLEPEEVEEYLGTAEVRQVFNIGKGSVAGCYVQSGRIVRNRRIRVRRGNEVIHEGTLDSLKREKENTTEVKAGFECGIGTAKFNEWKEGDLIEVHQMILKRRTLSVK
ncbi:translation initiation factor IF-2 [Oscillatoria sp. FACHB-1406]|uniref:translation initiation factor IF-2 n=1 Tax=Oscillatoria sp. FACHB-1406 TaxID=2692846 RepID=UPI0016840DF0|nr:translation initiation factor IF-2 [Oscillatoria sp. FACHB-1406]MBD2576406.1 translation initiation factor IF-2 [Oscillatoria sp. FACHB-1406]